MKIRYGSVKFLPNLFLAGEPKPLDLESDLKSRDYVKKLKDEGLVVFESAHPELADYINKTIGPYNSYKSGATMCLVECYPDNIKITNTTLNSILNKKIVITTNIRILNEKKPRPFSFPIGTS